MGLYIGFGCGEQGKGLKNYVKAGFVENFVRGLWRS